MHRGPGCGKVHPEYRRGGRGEGTGDVAEAVLAARLNTILALVLMLGLAINIARLLLEAGPRVQAEDQSVIRLARGFVRRWSPA